MTLTIDSKLERRIRIAAESQGRSAEDLLRKVIEEGLARVEQKPSAQQSEAEVAQRQRAALEELFVELDQIPMTEPDDGRGSVDHDKIIYRRDW